LNHAVGIRPTTKHRQPFVGSITALPNAYCFNGFGSKGCLIIPYYAQLLRSHILNNAKLPSALTQWL
jgi:glycine/D-amino acid oxidase-like deaminating enzyme